MTKAIEEPALAPEVNPPDALVCRFRPIAVTGRQGPILNMGEVELENCSAVPLEVKYTMTPLQFFELEVIGPDGATVSEGHFSDRFSPMLEPLVLRLLPGEKFRSRVSLLATVPLEKRRPGTYVVRASYFFQGRHVLAEPLSFELASNP